MPDEIPVCTKHDKKMILVEGKYYCKDCLYSSFLTASAQSAAVTRYNHTEKHKTAEKAYEDKNPTAREKYLHSEKYKARRREYNERLAESLRIARQAHLERAQSTKVVEYKQKEDFAELIENIREWSDSQGNRRPSAKNVVKWALDDFDKKISLDQASTIIDRALLRR